MKVCPECQARFVGNESFCPNDATPLVDARELSPGELTGMDLTPQIHLEHLDYSDRLGERYAGELRASKTPLRVTVFNQGFVPAKARLETLGKGRLALGEYLPAQILSLHSLDLEGTRPFVAEEAPAGPSLKQVIDERKALDWQTAARITCNVGRALEYLAERDLIYLGLHAGAIFVNDLKSGQIQLGEWSHSLLAHPQRPLELDEDADAAFLGYSACLAPEAIRDAADADQRSLVYSLAMLFYQLIVGKPPFTSKTTADSLKRHLHEKPLKLSIARGVAGLPSDIDDILDMMWIKAPERRFQKISAAIAAIASLFDEPIDDIAPAIIPAQSSVFEHVDESHIEEKPAEETPAVNETAGADEASGDQVEEPRAQVQDSQPAAGDEKRTIMGMPAVAIVPQQENSAPQADAEQSENASEPREVAEKASAGASEQLVKPAGQEPAAGPSIIIDDPELRAAAAFSDSENDDHMESEDKVSEQENDATPGDEASISEEHISEDSSTKEDGSTEEKSSAEDKNSAEEADSAVESEESTVDEPESVDSYSKGTMMMGSIIVDDEAEQVAGDQDPTGEDEVTEDDSTSASADLQAAEDLGAEPGEEDVEARVAEDEAVQSGTTADEPAETLSEETSESEEKSDDEVSDTQKFGAQDGSKKKKKKKKKKKDKKSAQKESAEEDSSEKSEVEADSDLTEESAVNEPTDTLADQPAAEKDAGAKGGLNIGFIETANDGGGEFAESWFGADAEDAWERSQIEEHLEHAETRQKYITFGLIGVLALAAIIFIAWVQLHDPQSDEDAAEQARIEEQEAEETRGKVERMAASVREALDSGHLIRPRRESAVSRLEQLKTLDRDGATYNELRSDFVQKAMLEARKNEAEDLPYAVNLAGYAAQFAKNDATVNAYAEELRARQSAPAAAPSEDADGEGEDGEAEDGTDEAGEEKSAENTDKDEKSAAATKSTKENKSSAAKGSSATPASSSAPASKKRSVNDILNEARAALNQKKNDEAAKLYREALAQNANSAPANAGLGDLLFNQAEHSQALPYQKKAVQLAPKNVGYAINLGKTYFRLEQYADAQKVWKQALANDPNNATVKQHLKLVESRL